LSESGFLATFEEGFGAFDGPLALLLLFDGLAEGFAGGRGAGAELIRGALLGGELWRATGRASGFRLLLLLFEAAGRWGARLGALAWRCGAFGAWRCTTLGCRDGAERFTVGRLGADRCWGADR
jgi:hypothetical protein